MSDDPLLIKLAGAIADGTEPDWQAAESTVGSREHQRIVDDLRLIADLAAVHRASEVFPAAPAAEVRGRAGARWGPLELRHQIGSGRFATVYLAWDPMLEREVAVKLLSETGSAEIIREARLLARVRHPNVVAVYGVDQYDGVVGLWMEFVDGLTLTRVVATGGVLGPREAALMGIDLCRAVAAVHKAGLVHRDIKAQNVMREAGGRIVLMDFGAGELRADRAASSRITGTPLYLAPELFDSPVATIASDIYSIGVLLFHLVSMGWPVAGATIEEIAAAHVRGRRQRLADLRPDLPGRFVRVVDRALERDPAHRYRSSGEMQQDLVSALELESPWDVAESAAATRPPTSSVAVLPFSNLGPDQDIEYFCNGLAEELLTGLAKVPGLRVASRTSAFRVAQTETDIRSICQQLKVDSVLEGTVRKAGERVRITAQLVSAADGCHLWSEGYDRPIADVFAVQEEIAHSVVDRLKVSLAEFPRQPLIRRHTHNARAYHAYLKGRFYWTRRFHGGLIAALDHFNKAIEEDAGYALAYAGLADAYSLIGIYAVQRPRSAFAQAAVAVERALALDADLSEAHASLALIKLANDWDLPEAAREFTRALQLDPGQAVTRIYRSWLMVLQGDLASAMVEVRTAQEIEPLSPLVNAGAGHTLYLARRYKEAIAECEKSLEIDPHFILGIHVIGMCRALQGQLAEAIEVGERTVLMSGRAPFYLGVLGHYYARSGAVDMARTILTELEETATQRYVPPHCMTYIYAGLNDLDGALEWEAKAYEDGASPFHYLSPLIENLHSHPRHIDYMRQMGWRA